MNSISRQMAMVKFYVRRIYHNLKVFAKWAVFSSITGLVVGAFSTLFAECLKLVTQFRTANPWMILLLPLVGIVIVFLYHIFHYKNDKGTNMVLSTIHAERLKKGHMFTDEYFDRQLQQIREIRLSERKFYQKVTDLYATAFDYDKDAKTTRLFFKTVQNKMHFAVHRHTAAELIVERADATKEHMGLTTWENAPDGKILKADVTVAKNYLNEQEMNYLERIVSLYLDYAELQAERKIPMSMEDWAKRLDGFLEFNGNELLTGPGKISAEQAKLHAETEYEKYRVIQDRLYECDFDRFMMLEKEVSHKDEV